MNHHNLSLEYYEKALSYFPRDQQVVIFSDDTEWCMEQLLFVDDRFIVSEGNGSYHDLYLMTKCSDFIISNSTYSWWGAWLANKGTVIAPDTWFGPNNAHKSLKDFISFSLESNSFLIAMTWNVVTVAFGDMKYKKDRSFLIDIHRNVMLILLDILM